MNPALNLRFAKPTDFAKCRKLDPKITRERFVSKQRQKEIVVFTSGSQVLGYLRFDYIWLKIPYISWICVSKTHRRAGIAELLLGFVATYLKKKKFKFLLSSHQDNALTSKKWHKQMGFKKCGFIGEINADGSKEIYVKKVL